MADNNGDGIDDQTGSAVAPSFGGLATYPVNGATSTSAAKQPVTVFWGYDNRKQYSLAEIDAGAPAGGGQREVYRPVDNATAYISWVRASDPKAYEALVGRMYQSGAIGADASFNDVQRAWGEAVGLSVDAGVNGTKITPFDAIDLIGSGTPGGASAFTGTKTQLVNSTSTNTNTQVNLSSASEARAFLLAAAERELGRAATKDEIEAFRRGLNGEEKKNAEKTTTTSKTTGTQSTTYEAGDAVASSDNTNTSQSSTTTGGMDRGQYAIDTARSAQDYAEYTAATKYMDALFASMQSTAKVGGN